MVEDKRGMGAGLRGLLVDSPNSLGARKRGERWKVFMRSFPDLASLRVIDLGGTVEWWLRAPVTPAQVTIVNLFEPGESHHVRLRPVAGDACSARVALEHAGLETQYDLAFSNSLLEHVGGHAKRLALAEEVRRLAPRHWVQTPYRYFPVEPHWLFPGMQFLPVAARARIAATWPLAHSRPADDPEAVSVVQWTELLGVTEMRAYFPTSDIVRETVMGLTKSLVAVAGASESL